LIRITIQIVQANKTTSSLSHTPKQASAIVVLAYAAGHKQASHKKSAGKQDGRLKQAMALHGSRRASFSISYMQAAAVACVGGVRWRHPQIRFPLRRCDSTSGSEEIPVAVRRVRSRRWPAWMQRSRFQALPFCFYARAAHARASPAHSLWRVKPSRRRLSAPLLWLG
jgi:hypothetical protein